MGGGADAGLATIGEAQRIAGLILDPNQVPTEEELERLAGFMEQHAEDEEFAFLFLTDLGPAGVIELNVGLAVLAGETDLAALATIQEGLATATTRRGGFGSAPWGGGEMYYPGEHELPPEWIQALRDAGRG